MNGPEHYRKAEELLNLAEQGVTLEGRQVVVSAAQVHATLALVAARLPIPRDHRAWADVLNGEPG